MAAPKGHPRWGGRKKGTTNKATASAREAMALAFEGLGGVEALGKWAEANQTEFYKLYARLIPTEITGKDGGPIEMTRLVIHD